MSELVRGRSLLEGALVDWAVAEPASLPRLPVSLLDREQTAAELQRVVAQSAMLAAYETELVLALADASPESDDPPPGARRAARGSWRGRKPLPGASEFFPAELAAVLNCGRGTAGNLAARARTHRENLPGTCGALAAGVLDEPRARVLAEVLEVAERDVARRVEAVLLPEATDLSLGRLRKRALALLLQFDAGAADRRREAAEREADVRVHPSLHEGMATLTAELPADEAAACHDVVDRLAGMLKADGDDRPIGALRTRVFADLLLCPWDDSRPPVTAQLQVVAALAGLEGRSDEAGEVSGLAITAAHVRELARRLGALGPAGLQPPVGGSVTVGVTGDDGALLATATLDQLRELARRGCPGHPDGDCGCPVLRAPAEVDGYAPSRPQQRFLRTRDRACRFPNCGQRVGWADADHVVPHRCGGRTDCANPCCLCRSHHRLKTFARGWQFALRPDGTLTVTTPSGVTRTTRPPGLRPPTATPRPDGPAAGEPAAGQAGGSSGRRRRRPRNLTLWLIEHCRRRPFGDDPPPF